MPKRALCLVNLKGFNESRAGIFVESYELKQKERIEQVFFLKVTVSRLNVCLHLWTFIKTLHHHVKEKRENIGENIVVVVQTEIHYETEEDSRAVTLF